MESEGAPLRKTENGIIAHLKDHSHVHVEVWGLEGGAVWEVIVDCKGRPIDMKTLLVMNRRVWVVWQLGWRRTIKQIAPVEIDLHRIVWKRPGRLGAMRLVGRASVGASY